MLAPQLVDDAALLLIFGEARVSTLPALAKLFGVAPQTVKQWRQAGMPGKPGDYRIRHVAKWLIERRRREAARDGQVADPIKQRLQQVELETAELNLSKRQRVELTAAGRMIDRHTAVAGACSVLAAMRERFCDLPDSVQCMLPLALAEDVCQQIGAEVRRILNQLSGDLARSVGAEGRELVEIISEYEKRKELNHESN